MHERGGTGRGILVSDLGRQVGIAPSAIRWYEAQGVIPTAERRDNGYRTNDAEDIARLRLVVSLRGWAWVQGRLDDWEGREQAR